MELDWYTDKLSVDTVLTPSSSFRWMSTNGGDPDRPSSPRWLFLLNLIQESGLLRGYHSGDEYSPRGSNTPSPKKPSGGPYRRSFSGGGARCPSASPRSSSLSPSSLSKSQNCFCCVLHSHPQ